MSGTPSYPPARPAAAETIRSECGRLAGQETRGTLGDSIARLVLAYSPRDLNRMQGNFSEKARAIDPAYRKRLEETVAAYLNGTYQTIRLMARQGSFAGMGGPVPDGNREYWAMVAAQCAAGDDGVLRLRFLKYLLAGFCMLVQGIPGHPAGMPFPGGDTVELVDGVYYCPVRVKANDVGSALCPFCPARQTPEVGYLKPPAGGSEHRKQEFIRNCYDFHNFNG